MGMPKKLKNMNVFNNGGSFLGEVMEVTLPVLTRTMEDYRGGGMDGVIPVDLGQEKIEMEHKYGGFMREIYRQYGLARHDGARLRFAGAYQADDTGVTMAVEIFVGGRHEEIDAGSAKPGDDTEFSVKTVCSYYRLTVNGRVEVEIDIMNMRFIVDGIDRLAEQRAIIT